MDNDRIIPTTEIIENTRKTGKKLTIATVFVSIIALVGIGYSIYSVTQNIDKEQQIAALREQIEKGNNELQSDSNSGTALPLEKDINEGQAVALYHYVSNTNEKGDRYTLILSKTEGNTGFFILTRTSAQNADQASGSAIYTDESITLTISPTTENALRYASDFGFTFNTDLKYVASYDEDAITLGNVTLLKID